MLTTKHTKNTKKRPVQGTERVGFSSGMIGRESPQFEPLAFPIDFLGVLGALGGSIGLAQ